MNIDNPKNRCDYVETVLRTFASDISLTRAVAELAEAIKIAASDPDQLEPYMLAFQQRWQIAADIAGEYDGAIIFHDEHS